MDYGIFNAFGYTYGSVTRFTGLGKVPGSCGRARGSGSPGRQELGPGIHIPVLSPARCLRRPFTIQ